jgi:hypothetical protein
LRHHFILTHLCLVRLIHGVIDAAIKNKKKGIHCFNEKKIGAVVERSDRYIPLTKLEMERKGSGKNFMSR